MAIPVRPIPGSFFEWEDQSAIQLPEIRETISNEPLFATVFTSDKGPEDWQVVTGADFFDLYAINDIVSFEKHGQPLLQAAMTINAGGHLLCKRVTADDARLANICICATVVSSTSEKTVTVIENGVTVTKDVYVDNITGEETYDAVDAEGIDNERAEIKYSTVTYSYKTVEDCNNVNEVAEAIREDIASLNEPEGTKTYPLWVIADTGRGKSRKRIRITPNYSLSKNYNRFFLYDLDVMESNNQFGTIHFALNPDMLEKTKNISFAYRVNAESSQVQAYQFREELLEFIDVMMDSTGLLDNEAASMDLLFGTDKRGRKILDSSDTPKYGIKIDTEAGVDISIISGQILMNGTNGKFGDAPIKEARSINGVDYYATQLAKAFAGIVATNPAAANPKYTILTDKDDCYDPIIYNVDRYKIDLVCDANYPNLVKRAIEELADFREDFMYFRDLGTNCNTIGTIKEADKYNQHTKFATTYCTYYDIIDPYSKKQITVTMPYHLSQMAVDHFISKRNAPMAGLKYGFVIQNILEDTISFTPTICPGLNEKEDLYDMRINYATYIDNQFVIESLYTSQDAYTQLSFSNNVLAVQRMIKAIRSNCPSSRYSFIDGDDLIAYQRDIERYIEPYRNDFAELRVEYLQDPMYSANKIFYAALGVRFRDFVQTEFFKITALSSTDGV